MDLRDVYSLLKLAVVPLGPDGRVLCTDASPDVSVMRAWQQEFPGSGIGLDLQASGCLAFQNLHEVDRVVEPYCGFIQTARVCWGRKQWVLFRRHPARPVPHGCHHTGVLPLPPSVVASTATVWRHRYHALEVGLATFWGANLRAVMRRAPPSFFDVRDPPGVAQLESTREAIENVSRILRAERRPFSQRELMHVTGMPKEETAPALRALRHSGDVVWVQPWLAQWMPGARHNGFLWHSAMPYR